MDWWQFATIVATAVGSLAAFGAYRVTAVQRGLQEAANESYQRREWELLRPAWIQARLAASGPDHYVQVGATNRQSAELREALEVYSRAEVDYAVAYQGGALYEPENEKQRASIEAQLSLSSDLIAPYREAARTVIVHLSQVASLVINKRLSINACYSALGYDLVAARRALIPLTSIHPMAEGCPGSYIPFLRQLKNMDSNEVAGSIGWATEFADNPGVPSSVRALAEIMESHAASIGDSGFLHGGPGADENLLSYREHLYGRARVVSRGRARRLLWLSYFGRYKRDMWFEKGGRMKLKGLRTCRVRYVRERRRIEREYPKYPSDLWLGLAVES